MVTNSYSAIVLAGGQSSRMGTDKSKLIFEGETLVERQCRKLREVGIEDIVVSGYGEGMVPDENPGQGPLGGLATCLRLIKNDSAIVVPVDVPLITARVFNGLMDTHSKSVMPVTVALNGEKAEYLIGVYDKRIVPQIDEMLEDGTRAVRMLLELTGCNFARFYGAEREFQNANTPESFAALNNM